jgi:hypothetical protein
MFGPIDFGCYYAPYDSLGHIAPAHKTYCIHIFLLAKTSTWIIIVFSIFAFDEYKRMSSAKLQVMPNLQFCRSLSIKVITEKSNAKAG